MVPAALAGSLGTYTAPCLPNSDVPGLWGILKLELLNAIIDCRKDRRAIYLCDDDVDHVDIKYTEKTDVVKLKKAPSGHLLMPITGYANAKKTKKKVTFQAEEVTSSAPS